jgi:hypothetical protein
MQADASKADRATGHPVCSRRTKHRATGKPHTSKVRFLRRGASGNEEGPTRCGSLPKRPAVPEIWIDSAPLVTGVWRSQVTPEAGP